MRRLPVAVLLGSAGLVAAGAHPGPAPRAHEVPPVAEPRLQRLVGRWYVTASTFGGPPDTTAPTFVATPAALGRAVYSVWKQGSGAGAYEANALWAHDSVSRQVRVFETNSLGVAETHVGAFDGTEALVVELRGPGGGAMRERRVFTWSGDTLRMTARFIANGRVTDHAVTLVRRR